MYRIIESSPGPKLGQNPEMDEKREGQHALMYSSTITSPMIDGLRAPYLAVGGMDLKLST
ncbi:hypothetical protein PABG_02552 [Paracoccidioides brasiliensis Pb03]|nr:hypothetical protein PABG_02552 [Paracoccidioides brasiliensis Pb03]